MKTPTTNVVRTDTKVVRTIVGLRATIDRVLHEKGELHGAAAQRAEVSHATWSRTLNANPITEEQLALLARGCELTPEQLQEKCT